MSGREVRHAWRELLADVGAEIGKRHKALGTIRRMPDGTGRMDQQVLERHHRVVLDALVSSGRATWADYLTAQSYAALAQADAAHVRTVLIELAATCLEWARDIDLTSEANVADEVVCSEPEPPRIRPLPGSNEPEGYHVPPTQLTPGGPTHGGFYVIEAGNYDQP